MSDFAEKCLMLCLAFMAIMMSLNTHQNMIITKNQKVIQYQIIESINKCKNYTH